MTALNTDEMFTPLDKAKSLNGPGQVHNLRPIISPVPTDAPDPMDYRHPQLGAPSNVWSYTDTKGRVLHAVARFLGDGEKKEFRPLVCCQDGERVCWRSGGPDGLRPLYNLHEIASKQHKTVVFVEGEKTADAARELLSYCVSTTTMNGAKSPDKTDFSPLAGRDVIIWPDNDQPGADFAIAVTALCRKAGAASVSVVPLPDNLPIGWDLADHIPEGVDLEARLDAAMAQQVEPPKHQTRLRPMDVHQLLAMHIPPREFVLDPAIPQKGLSMVYSGRGVGKTQIAVGISIAVSTGTPFLKWASPKPRRVLHVDGEMAAADLRERFKRIIDSSDVKPEPGMLEILTADLIEFGIGNLASPDVQAELDPWLDGVELLILDNLSSLTHVIRDNDAESWNPIQEWLLRLRRRGVSVCVFHHAGKGGEQRGTSRREDVLDISISLRHPSDYVPAEGARFEVHFEKSRGVFGDCVRPFEAKMEVLNDKTIWTTREIEDVNYSRVKALLDDDLSVRDIADETGISKSTVHRLKKQIEADALTAATQHAYSE